MSAGPCTPRQNLPRIHKVEGRVRNIPGIYEAKGEIWRHMEILAAAEIRQSRK
jgi:hypothetical protein